MARNFGKIEVSTWKAAKFRALSDDAKMLYLYLIACPHGNAIGCFVLDPEYVQADLKWAPTRVSTHMSELVSRGMIERDSTSYLTFLTGWWGHNTIENGFVAKAAVKTIASLPKCGVLNSAIKALDAAKDAFTDKAKDAFTHLYIYVSQDASETSVETRPQTKEPEPEPEPEMERRPRAPARKGSRLAEDWTPTADQRTEAAKRGLTEPEIDSIAERYRRYWTGPDAREPVKKDWDRTWANWLDRDAPEVIRRRPRGASTPMLVTPQTADFGDARRREANLWRARLDGAVWLPSWGTKEAAQQRLAELEAAPAEHSRGPPEAA